jgi:hypothetical protein
VASGNTSKIEERRLVDKAVSQNETMEKTRPENCLRKRNKHRKNNEDQNLKTLTTCGTK